MEENPAGRGERTNLEQREGKRRKEKEGEGESREKRTGSRHVGRGGAGGG